MAASETCLQRSDGSPAWTRAGLTVDYSGEHFIDVGAFLTEKEELAYRRLWDRLAAHEIVEDDRETIASLIRISPGAWAPRRTVEEIAGDVVVWKGRISSGTLQGRKLETAQAIVQRLEALIERQKRRRYIRDRLVALGLLIVEGGRLVLTYLAEPLAKAIRRQAQRVIAGKGRHGKTPAPGQTAMLLPMQGGKAASSRSSGGSDVSRETTGFRSSGEGDSEPANPGLRSAREARADSLSSLVESADRPDSAAPAAAPDPDPAREAALLLLLQAFVDSRKERFPDMNLAPPKARLEREAEKLLRLGLPAAEIAEVVSFEMGRLPAGAPAPMSLNFFERSVRMAAAKARERARDGGESAPPAAAATPKTPEEEARAADRTRWWRHVSLFFSNGFWPSSEGPAPGLPGCRAAQWLVDEERAKAEKRRAEREARRPGKAAAS